MTGNSPEPLVFFVRIKLGDLHDDAHDYVLPHILVQIIAGDTVLVDQRHIPRQYRLDGVRVAGARVSQHFGEPPTLHVCHV